MTYPTTTYTVSSTNTFTEARARAVMTKVLADFVGLATTGLIEVTTMKTWHEEISYAMQHNAVKRFQLKLTLPAGGLIALDYIISDDGSLLEDSDSGGIDFFALPSDTKISVVLSYREGCPHLEKVQTYLRSRGWGTNGTFVEGDARRDGAYSKEGFGATRYQIGNWPS